MEELRQEFDYLRFLVRNLDVELRQCKEFYRQYTLFLTHFPTRYPLLYSLATTPKKRPIYVVDARKREDGSWHSDTFECLLVVKHFVLELLDYGPRLHAYLHDLNRATHSLVREMKAYGYTYRRHTHTT